jgi:hypothetical protein
MGIVAHPGDITSIDVSYDGAYMFTAGGFDLSVNMWRIGVEEHRRARQAAAVANASASEYLEEEERPAVESEASALRPFFSLLEGGEDGELHRDIVDYFYYCQLRHLGEDSMEPRQLTGTAGALSVSAASF